METVTDAHIHIMPLRMMKSEVRRTFTSAASYDEALYRRIMKPKELVDILEREGVLWVNIMSYQSKDVMGFGDEMVDFVGRYCRYDPDRLKAVISVDPRAEGDPVKKLEGFRSKYDSAWIKLHPVHQLFKPNAYRPEEGGTKALPAIYEYADSNRMPITIHTGSSIFPGARIKYGDPIYLDDVATDYPGMKIVMAHGGRPFWTDKAFFILRRHRNVYLDISGVPPKKLLEYFPRLPDVWEKVIFGSDWPTMGVRSIRQNAEDVISLGLPRAAVRGILRDNIRRLVSG